MSVRTRIPESVKGPLGVVSLAVMILGLVVGYIFTMIGVTLYFGLNGIEGISTGESVLVVATGLVCLVAGYFGWKGFIGFAY
ncbi:hypothetical protein [Halobaculum litoreum]|nr:hypothetical protein [Halobaculum sp. DT92]